MNTRLHHVLLTLWDLARDNPGYDRKLWGELQQHLLQLESRNKVLRTHLVDLLRFTDDEGDNLWEETPTQSPPRGYAIKFMAPSPIDIVADLCPPPLPTKQSEVGDRLIDDALANYDVFNPSPSGVCEEYDVGDESEDELTFDFSSSDDTVT